MWYKVNKIRVGTKIVRPSSRLPSAYQEVKYIENSWITQYINTWIIPTSNTKVELKINITQFVSWGTDAAVYWVWNYNNSTWRFNLWYWANGWLGFWYGNNNWGNYKTALSLNTDAVIENYISSWTVYNVVNWVSKTYSWASFSTDSYSMIIFWRKTPSDNDLRLQYKLYYFQIYESWTLVRDFVPCYRKSDKVIWLYDLVNNQFYTNAWTGTFTKWWNVN